MGNNVQPSSELQLGTVKCVHVEVEEWVEDSDMEKDSGAKMDRRKSVTLLGEAPLVSVPPSGSPVPKAPKPEAAEGKLDDIVVVESALEHESQAKAESEAIAFEPGMEESALESKSSETEMGEQCSVRERLFRISELVFEVADDFEVDFSGALTAEGQVADGRAHKWKPDGSEDSKKEAVTVRRADGEPLPAAWFYFDIRSLPRHLPLRAKKAQSLISACSFRRAEDGSECAWRSLWSGQLLHGDVVTYSSSVAATVPRTVESTQQIEVFRDSFVGEYEFCAAPKAVSDLKDASSSAAIGHVVHGGDEGGEEGTVLCTDHRMSLADFLKVNGGQHVVEFQFTLGRFVRLKTHKVNWGRVYVTIPTRLIQKAVANASVVTAPAVIKTEDLSTATETADGRDADSGRHSIEERKDDTSDDRCAEMDPCVCSPLDPKAAFEFSSSSLRSGISGISAVVKSATCTSLPQSDALREDDKPHSVGRSAMDVDLAETVLQSAEGTVTCPLCLVTDILRSDFKRHVNEVCTQA